jgi:hypothetical protein
VKDAARYQQPARRAAVQERAHGWRRRFPLKAAAHAAVACASRRGTLVRQTCQVCGSARSHAHHDDYSKPLTVRWLCALHHKEAKHR